MKLGIFAVTASLLIGTSGYAQVQGYGQGAAMRQRIQQVRQQLLDLRQAVRDSFEASDRGDFAAAEKAADRAQALWKTLPQKARDLVEERHPGATDRLHGLKEEVRLSAASITTTRQDNWAKNGNTVTHDETVTGPKGKTATRDDTWTKSGNTVTHDETVTGPNGKTATKDATWTKDGNTITRDATATGPNGKTATSEDTWTKSGNTITHEGETTGPNGQSVTRDSTLTKDGSTVTRDATTTGPKGQSVTRDDTWQKSGNTVTHTGTVTGSGTGSAWKPVYHDEHDIFGGRPQPTRNTAGGAGRASGGRSGGGRR